MAFGASGAGTEPARGRMRPAAAGLSDCDTLSQAVPPAAKPRPVCGPERDRHVASRAVNVATQLSLTFSACDPDRNALAYSLQQLPSGAALGGAQFTWTRSAGQTGNYQVTVRVTDNGSPAANDSEAIMIRVGNANLPP